MMNGFERSLVKLNLTQSGDNMQYLYDMEYDRVLVVWVENHTNNKCRNNVGVPRLGTRDSGLGWGCLFGMIY